MLCFPLMIAIVHVIEQFLVLLLAISVHESAHAWTANRFGDPTARFQGRITLNPIAHLDLMGSLIFPGLLLLINLVTHVNGPIFGWAKPVMVNPYNLKNPRRDGMFISAAGPIANLLLASLAIVFFLIVKQTPFISYNPLVIFLLDVILINVFLMVFNLIPIPPLDGSGILEGFLSGNMRRAYERIRPYGFLILMAFLYLGLLDYVARPIVNLVLIILGYGG